LKTVGIEGLGQGIPYPPSASGKTDRKIGANLATTRALRRISMYTDASFFLAAVPFGAEVINQFFTERFPEVRPEGFIGWDSRHYGYLCWKDVENFCTNCGLDNSRNNFYFNRGQLYLDSDS
jgi:hypothetical protein